MPGSLQPQSAREWPPGDVAPVARGHERPSPNLTVVARERLGNANDNIKLEWQGTPSAEDAVNPAKFDQYRHRG